MPSASKDNIEAQNVAANHTISFRLKTGARLFYGILTCVSMLSFLFAFALLVPHCVAGFPSMPDQELVHAEHIVSEAAHELARRGDSKDNTVAYDPSAKVLAATAGTIAVERSTVTPYLTLTASSASAYFTTSSVSIMTPSLDDRGHTGGVTIPVSTETELSTIYTISYPEVTTLTSTTTATTSITLPVSSVSESISTETDCQASTVFVTVTVVPTPSVSAASTTSLEPATVTGTPGTVTEVNTDVSYITGLPDVTVSGSPWTYTDVQTDVSVITGPGDATVSGNPSTLTNLQTDYSLSTTLPDATVPGSPDTVTDVGVSYSFTTVTGSISPSLTTVTAVSTAKTTVTTIDPPIITVTISDLYPPTSPEPSNVQSSDAKGAAATTSSSATSTSTVTVTETGGEPAISTTTVEVTPSALYPTGNVTATYPIGTVTNVPGPTTPLVVSGGNKKPEPRGFSMSPANLGRTIMIVGLVMFML